MKTNSLKHFLSNWRKIAALAILLLANASRASISGTANGADSDQGRSASRVAGEIQESVAFQEERKLIDHIREVAGTDTDNKSSSLSRKIAQWFNFPNFSNFYNYNPTSGGEQFRNWNNCVECTRGW